MKLVLLVVRDGDADNIVDALVDHGYHVTRMASSGGFLREGNSLLLSGVEDEQLEPLLETVQRYAEANPRPPVVGRTGEVHVSRAVVFICSLERVERL